MKPLIGIDVDIKSATQGIELSARAIEIATQRAVLKTAHKVRVDVTREMERVFDRPTRWTLNSFRVALGRERLQGGRLRTIAGSDVYADVEVKDGYWYRAANYLDTQIRGANARQQKAFEIALRKLLVLPNGYVAVPGEKAKIDAYGNQSVGEIRQILSWFNAAEMVAGSTQNMTAETRERRRRGTRTRRGYEYFAVSPGARRTGLRSNGKAYRNRLHPGIYRRSFFAFGEAIEPVMIFVRRAGYRPRFDFFGAAERTVRREFRGEMAAALQVELARAKVR